MKISFEQLKAVKTIICHDNCSDGLMSALLLHDALPDAEVRFLQYGSEPYKTLEPSPGMLFADFSPFVPSEEVDVGGIRRRVYNQEILDKWSKSDIIVLDHHDGAKEVVAAFGDRGIFADAHTEPGVSGALLAFTHVWDPIMKVNHDAEYQNERERAMTFAKAVGVRDTWQRHHSGWEAACELNSVLAFYPKEDWMAMKHPFTAGLQGVWEERLKLGAFLWAKHNNTGAKVAEKALRWTSDSGVRAAIFPGIRMTSDVAEYLDKEVDLIMGFDYEVEKLQDGGVNLKIIFSTRSHTGFDCAAFAKGYGGGGHKAAAGFSIPLRSANPMADMARSMDPFALAQTLLVK